MPLPMLARSTCSVTIAWPPATRPRHTAASGCGPHAWRAKGRRGAAMCSIQSDWHPANFPRSGRAETEPADEVSLIRAFSPADRQWSAIPDLLLDESTNARDQARTTRTPKSPCHPHSHSNNRLQDGQVLPGGIASCSYSPATNAHLIASDKPPPPMAASPPPAGTAGSRPPFADAFSPGQRLRSPLGLARTQPPTKPSPHPHRENPLVRTGNLDVLKSSPTPTSRGGLGPPAGTNTAGSVDGQNRPGLPRAPTRRKKFGRKRGSLPARIMALTPAIHARPNHRAPRRRPQASAIMMLYGAIRMDRSAIRVHRNHSSTARRRAPQQLRIGGNPTLRCTVPDRMSVPPHRPVPQARGPTQHAGASEDAWSTSPSGLRPGRPQIAPPVRPRTPPQTPRDPPRMRDHCPANQTKSAPHNRAPPVKPSDRSTRTPSGRLRASGAGTPGIRHLLLRLCFRRVRAGGVTRRRASESGIARRCELKSTCRLPTQRPTNPKPS